jgi:hypothetical protein
MESCLMHFVLKAGIAFSQHALLLLEGLYSLLQLLHIPLHPPLPAPLAQTPDSAHLLLAPAQNGQVFFSKGT